MRKRKVSDKSQVKLFTFDNIKKDAKVEEDALDLELPEDAMFIDNDPKTLERKRKKSEIQKQ